MSLVAEGLPELVTFLGARLIASELHERAHACAAMLLGHKPASRPFGARATIVLGLARSHLPRPCPAQWLGCERAACACSVGAGSVSLCCLRILARCG